MSENSKTWITATVAPLESVSPTTAKSRGGSAYSAIFLARSSYASQEFEVGPFEARAHGFGVLVIDTNDDVAAIAKIAHAQSGASDLDEEVRVSSSARTFEFETAKLIA